MGRRDLTMDRERIGAVIDKHGATLSTIDRAAILEELTTIVDLLDRHYYAHANQELERRTFRKICDDLALDSKLQAQNYVLNLIGSGRFDDPIGAARQHFDDIPSWCWITVTNGHGIELEDGAYQLTTAHPALRARLLAWCRIADRLIDGIPPPA